MLGLNAVQFYQLPAPSHTPNSAAQLYQLPAPSHTPNSAAQLYQLPAPSHTPKGPQIGVQTVGSALGSELSAQKLHEILFPSHAQPIPLMSVDTGRVGPNCFAGVPVNSAIASDPMQLRRWPPQPLAELYAPNGHSSTTMPVNFPSPLDVEHEIENRPVDRSAPRRPSRQCEFCDGNGNVDDRKSYSRLRNHPIFKRLPTDGNISLCFDEMRFSVLYEQFTTEVGTFLSRHQCCLSLKRGSEPHQFLREFIDLFPMVCCGDDTVPFYGMAVRLFLLNPTQRRAVVDFIADYEDHHQGTVEVKFTIVEFFGPEGPFFNLLTQREYAQQATLDHMIFEARRRKSEPLEDAFQVDEYSELLELVKRRTDYSFSYTRFCSFATLGIQDLPDDPILDPHVVVKALRADRSSIQARADTKQSLKQMTNVVRRALKFSTCPKRTREVTESPEPDSPHDQCREQISGSSRKRPSVEDSAPPDADKRPRITVQTHGAEELKGEPPTTQSRKAARAKRFASDDVSGEPASSDRKPNSPSDMATNSPLTTEQTKTSALPSLPPIAVTPSPSASPLPAEQTKPSALPSLSPIAVTQSPSNRNAQTVPNSNVKPAPLPSTPLDESTGAGSLNSAANSASAHPTAVPPNLEAAAALPIAEPVPLERREGTSKAALALFARLNDQLRQCYLENAMRVRNGESVDVVVNKLRTEVAAAKLVDPNAGSTQYLLRALVTLIDNHPKMRSRRPPAARDPRRRPTQSPPVGTPSRVDAETQPISSETDSMPSRGNSVDSEASNNSSPIEQNPNAELDWSSGEGRLSCKAEPHDATAHNGDDGSSGSERCGDSNSPQRTAESFSDSAGQPDLQNHPEEDEDSDSDANQRLDDAANWQEAENSGEEDEEAAQRSDDDRVGDENANHDCEAAEIYSEDEEPLSHSQLVDSEPDDDRGLSPIAALSDSEDQPEEAEEMEEEPELSSASPAHEEDDPYSPSEGDTAILRRLRKAPAYRLRSNTPKAAEKVTNQSRSGRDEDISEKNCTNRPQRSGPPTKRPKPSTTNRRTASKVRGKPQKPKKKPSKCPNCNHKMDTALNKAGQPKTGSQRHRTATEIRNRRSVRSEVKATSSLAVEKRSQKVQTESSLVTVEEMAALQETIAEMQRIVKEAEEAAPSQCNAATQTKPELIWNIPEASESFDIPPPPPEDQCDLEVLLAYAGKTDGFYFDYQRLHRRCTADMRQRIFNRVIKSEKTQLVVLRISKQHVGSRDNFGFGRCLGVEWSPRNDLPLQKSRCSYMAFYAPQKATEEERAQLWKKIEAETCDLINFDELIDITWKLNMRCLFATEGPERKTAMSIVRGRHIIA